MKKLGVILLVIAIIWLFIVGWYNLSKPLICPSACINGKCGCDLRPNLHPIRDILIYAGIPALILVVLGIISLKSKK